jgi:hypothetical protein
VLDSTSIMELDEQLGPAGLTEREARAQGRAIRVAEKLPYTAMADAVFTHPLLAEGLNTLFAMF